MRNEKKGKAGLIEKGEKMRKILFNTIVFLLTIIFFSCSQMPKKPAVVPQPVVRVGLVEGAKVIKFESLGRFRILEKDGKQYRSDEKGEWTIKLENKIDAEIKYGVILFEAPTLESARNYEAHLNLAGKTEIRDLGDALKSGEKIIAGREAFIVRLKSEFGSRDAAETFAKSLNVSDYQIRNMGNSLPFGVVKIESPSGGKVTSKSSLRLTGSPITIKNITVGAGFHFARKEDRTYNGEIEIRMDKTGNLAVINVLTLDNYLQGVLPGEMTSSFPVEALKAQAICARTFFLYNFGKNHRDDPFDVCDNVHCQAFVGISKDDMKIRKAVRETQGLVLLHENKLCTTPYSGVCGGHTENAENVWIGDGEPYLQGVYDLDQKGNRLEGFHLAETENMEKWTVSRPTVFCNAEMNGNPKFAKYSNKYFRWSYSATRSDLEDVIKKKTGQDFGTLLDLVPIERGNSGRIISLSIIGTNKTFTIGKELRIRQTLSPTTLYSAAFSIEKLPKDNSIPTDFVLKGAGWGHGVGMCQIGAGVMAKKGYAVTDILAHYYTNIQITKYY
jgi:stage II sporulation protein D